VRRTTKLIEGGHRGLQAYKPICYYFYVYYVFIVFSKSKKSWLFTFFCRVSYVFSNYGAGVWSVCHGPNVQGRLWPEIPAWL